MYPAEARFREEAAAAEDPWGTPPVLEELKAEARRRGLWNLFLPRTHAHGAGLTNLQYAPLAEITGRNPWIAPEAINCSAPDTGNMELLSLFGTEEQQGAGSSRCSTGEMRSAFSMTEPEVASSDATNIATRIERDGDEYVINGRKWWTSGAMSPALRAAHRHGRHRPGRRAPPPPEHDPRAEGHAGRPDPALDEPLRLRRRPARRARRDRLRQRARAGVRTSSGEEGDGFRIAQERLGPGRIHHAMRAIGMAERALEMMCERTASRSTFGRPIIDHGVVQRWIAEARVRIEQARLLVLKTAWLMDTVGNRGARIEVSAIKVAAPEVATWVIDRAIQAHGGMGVAQDTLLPELYAVARILQIADGPDEVHYMAIARREARRYRPEPVTAA